MDDADLQRRRTLAQTAAMGEVILWEWLEHAADCELEDPDCQCLELYVARTLRWIVVVDFAHTCSVAAVS